MTGDVARAKFPRVLIVAHNASSQFGGESFLSLKYFQILSDRGVPAILITHGRNEADLRKYIPKYFQRIHFVNDTIWHRAAWRLGQFGPRRVRERLLSNILHLIDQAFQRRVARVLIAKGLVDVVHQPVPVSPKAPSMIHGLGVPVVIGPMNGGMTYPPGYEDHEGHLARGILWAGRALANLANRAIPGKRRAAVLLVANDRTRKALPLKDHPSVVRLVENGVDSTTWQRRMEANGSRDDGVFKLVFMGSLISLKAMDVTLDAVRLARGTGLDVRLDVLGDGAERHQLEALAVSMGLDNVVRFMGFRPQQECADVLFSSDALILNSVLECGGAVVLEAMSVGLPVIASDWGGPADYLDADCGILVPPVPRADFAKRLSDAILRLSADPALRHAMGRAGQRKVRLHFDWHDKVGKMLDIYRYAMSMSEARAEPTQSWDSASIPPSSL